MVSAHLDTLELELRKLEGVRTVGFSTQHDVLYIQLFIEAYAPAAVLPFEATRIAQRHSSSPVAVELVRWTDVSTQTKSNTSGLSSIFANTEAAQAVSPEAQAPAPVHAGSIGSFSNSTLESDDNDNDQEDQQESNSIELADDNIEPISAFGTTFEEPESIEEEYEEVDLTEDTDPQFSSFETAIDEDQSSEDIREEENDIERIALLLVTTSAENDEIEVHLSFDDLRTVGRAPTNRGLLGAIDATVSAIAELTGSDEFHAEWARSLEPGAEHASLVAVGLTNSEGTDTRHGIAGGSSPIEAAARATLNALNRTAVLSAADQ
ncbi:MAG TPA: hypothetical protein PLT55_02485 [Acidimicrobiia bacterium]|nr:hypothetical protein [Acidimicrobiia bacterium]